MNGQLGLFKGEKLNQHGLDAIEIKEGDFVGTARSIAELLAKKNGTVTMDEVREVLDLLGVQPAHSNSFGAVFKNKSWIYAGMRKSNRPSNHARMVRIWRCG